MASDKTILAQDRPAVPGRQPAKALFEEGVYDIKEFHRVFLEEEDPTEYRPALRLVGSWQEWNRLKRDWKGFNSYITLWKEELEVKLTSESISKIQQLSKGDDAKALQAAKYLSEAGWEKKAGKGRPSKAEKERQVKELANAAAETTEEKARILHILRNEPRQAEQG